MGDNKHAYLILVHNCPKLLQVLIDMIDDERNDIYLHVDAKADMGQFENIHAKKSKISYTKRVKVYWGNDAMIEAEYLLLEAAKEYGPYLYYHLMSGVDLPLKNQDSIHHLLDDVYRGHEFVGYTKNLSLTNRLRYFFLFDKHLRNDNTRKNRFFAAIRSRALSIQKKMGVWRNKDVEIMYGPQWWSITENLCSFLLSQKKRVKRIYHMTMNPDESFVQTFTYESPLYENVHDKEYEYKSCMRLIDWDKGPTYPHVWTQQDWEELTMSDRLFARKFSESDMDFIYRLKEYVLCGQNA